MKISKKYFPLRTPTPPPRCLRRHHSAALTPRPPLQRCPVRALPPRSPRRRRRRAATAVARRAAISRSLDAWLHRRCPFRIAVAPSIAVAVALPSCRPSPPSLVDCCRFHRHRRVNVYPPLLPLRSLCCACHRRPSPSRHPSPPSLVDCCIFHVHCCIAVHYRAAHHRRASPAAASTLLQSLYCCRAVH